MTSDVLFSKQAAIWAEILPTSSSLWYTATNSDRDFMGQHLLLSGEEQVSDLAFTIGLDWDHDLAMGQDPCELSERSRKYGSSLVLSIASQRPGSRSGLCRVHPTLKCDFWRCDADEMPGSGDAKP